MLIFNDIFWREPLWLLLALMPALPMMLSIFVRRNNKNFADAHLMPWVVHQQPTGVAKSLLTKNSAYIISWLLIGIAAAGPRIPSELSSHQAAVDLDIMLVVDVSRSMRATDVRPSRLRRAQIEIEELLERAAGARVGITVFAARPHLFVPLTFDHDAIRHYLKSLDDLILPTNGSDPVSALKLAEKELSGDNASAIIIISDGDFPEVDSQDLSQFSVSPTYALGIGSMEGEAILLENGQWLKYQGKPVISRLNEVKLQSFVNKINGSKKGSSNNNAYNKYSPAVDDGSDWVKIYDEGILKLVPPPEETHENEVIWDELFFWPLSPALILLWFSLMPFGFRDKKIPHSSSKHMSGSTAAIFPIILIIIFPGFVAPQSVSASTEKNESIDVNYEIDMSRAYRKYNDGNFLLAIDLYKNITGYAARLGEGACYYRLNKYSAAVRQYSQAVMLANDDDKRAVSLFNLGNAYFQMGDYGSAVSIYSDSLLYKPRQKNVLNNLEFSDALSKSIKVRLKQSRLIGRMGSGPQLASSRESTVNNMTGSLAIDQGTNKQTSDIPLPELADVSASALEKLIQKGMERIKLAAVSSSALAGPESTRKRIAMINARLLMSQLEDQQTELWKRLFEIEEGFPAPLSSPRDVPGVSPW